jgi:lipopolysaccharide transport system ATP-binding protein
MSRIVIQAENIGKSYIIGHEKQESYTALRDVITNKTKHIARKTKQMLLGGQLITGTELEDFWALKNINFEINQGESVGIIGRNGAGKSTLLKVLSRITEPSTGILKLKGRIACLLEVGTGFHPELTGRENIFLNGAILGMSRIEIRNKFDEIVDFSGVEKFLDTPVKRYSSGMYVRLAFAVAAHLESEILIVDEVLSVGDAEFQKKCLGKMGEVSKGEGRTVLFVSHNMGAIGQLCENCIWINEGSIKESGKTMNIINDYMKVGITDCTLLEKTFPLDDNKKCQLESFRQVNQNNELTQTFSCDETIILELFFRVNQTVPGLYCWLDLTKTDGTLVLMSDSFDSPPNPLDNLGKGRYLIKIALPPRTLAAGDYNINLVFTGFLGGAIPVDNPGTVGHIRIDDFVSKRGNQRPGFLSTLLPWEISEL